ncbi:deoxynucleoside kinase [Shewanella sp. 1_MG-2023]|uniref:dTMP kinase n=1 Tax=unclassified Shewanella TaxID=196818 RepID=UPI0026E27A5C|nr:MULTISPECIES: deoxynucleoside kinase [unclassified Shewanella]MDO6611378.1 deoxynucleoside kinase [Shewanella sp. 7_MG-2023]MDO6771233.1 deoxynucleoside kinase [Shewanella sp. 2_MG-2023]MDO6795474.1 deoxynucleoside kinase [Shewanella sp. 1_MG-2023]
MFIVIEGLDGVGKSTISAALAEALNTELLSTPGDKFRNVRNELDDIFRDNHQARQLFYTSTVVSIAEDIRQLIKDGKSVVVDRYWLSTQVYHHWKSEGNHFELLELKKSLLKPDVTIYLELSLAQRENRLIERNDSNSEDNLTLSEKADDELRQLYSDYSIDEVTGCFLSVDANKNVNELVLHICKLLKEFKK